MWSADELTEPERALWDAFPQGRLVDLRSGVDADDDPGGGAGWGDGRTVRAAVIAALLLGAEPALPGAVASLRLSGARITGRLDLDGAEVGSLLRLEHCHFEEPVRLYGATTRTIRITDSHLPGLDATLARIEGRLVLERSVLTGRLALVNARIGGELGLDGARLSAEADSRSGHALFAGGLAVEGSVFATRGFRAEGGVRLIGAEISGALRLDGARLDNPGGLALNLSHVTTTSVFLSDGFTAVGAVRLQGARISDQLTFDGATLRHDSGTAVNGLRLQAEEVRFTPAAPTGGAVDLRGARVGTLHDRADAWPRELRLEGFAYDMLRSDDDGDVGDVPTTGEGSRPQDVAKRLAWLRHNPGYAPQPYEQLAAWYRQIGHDDAARRVLLEKQRRRRRTLRPTGRAWGWLLDVTVGYGYRPWLAGLWLLALTLLGTLAFSLGTPTRRKPDEGGPFHPLVYTVDVLFPIGDFGQRSAWYLAGSAQWLAYLFMALGWLLTTAVVAGVSRALSRN
ncbi:oxidoreductase [Streptomyces sp. NPDC002851]